MLVFSPSCTITVIPTHRAINYFPPLSSGYTFHTPLGPGHAQWACLSPYKVLSFSYSFRPDEVYSSSWKLVFDESTVLFQRKSTSTKKKRLFTISPCFAYLSRAESSTHLTFMHEVFFNDLLANTLCLYTEVYTWCLLSDRPRLSYFACVCRKLFNYNTIMNKTEADAYIACILII